MRAIGDFNTNRAQTGLTYREDLADRSQPMTATHVAPKVIETPKFLGIKHTDFNTWQ